MKIKFIEGLNTRLYQCERVSPTGGARQVLDIVSGLGGRFLHIGSLRPHPDPAETINARGNIMVTLDLQHPLLAPDTATISLIPARNLPPDTQAWGSFSFLQTSRIVCICQDGSFSDRRRADPVALGQLALAQLLYPYLRPSYGWIDELGGNQPEAEELSPRRLEYIFWANVFGPDYVARFGREALLRAPGWKVEVLDDGGVLYVACESYSQWWEKAPDGILDYFRQLEPEINIYRAEELTCE